MSFIALTDTIGSNWYQFYALYQVIEIFIFFIIICKHGIGLKNDPIHIKYCVAFMSKVVEKRYIDLQTK